MRALILDTGSRSGLTGSRALAAAGWTVGIGSAQKGLAAWSRTSAYWHFVPSPADNLDRFVEATNAAIRAQSYEIVFGSGDVEVLALSLARDNIDATVPYADHGAVERALDKLTLALAARKAGLATPRTVEATEEALAAVKGPVVVKARVHWGGAADTPERLEAVVASNQEQAVQRVREISSAGGSPILQDLVPGTLLAYVVMVADGGSILAHVQQEADRTWPPEAGVTARGVTLPVDELLVAKAGLLLADLGWFGLAELQFVCADGGEPQLVDFNGRFYGSMALALAAGINMPAMWANISTGRPFAFSGKACPGVRYQWLEGDLRRSWIERHGGLVRDLLSCFAYAPGAAHSVWSSRDPWPLLRHVGSFPERALRKLRE